VPAGRAVSGRMGPLPPAGPGGFGAAPGPSPEAVNPPEDASEPDRPSAPWWAGPAVRMLGLLPWRLRWGLARLAVRLSRRRGGRMAVARTNLDIAFGDRLPPAEKDRIARESLVNLAGCMLDAVALIPRLTPEGWHRLVRVPQADIDALKKHLAEGRGALVMFSHLGNWELMGAAMAYMGFTQIHVVGKRQADWANDLIEGLRTRTGNRVIYKEGAVRATLKALKGGAIVGLSIDQNFSAGIFVPFFGVPAATPDTLAALARVSGAPIVPLVCVPDGRGTYAGRLLPAIHSQRTDDKAADLIATTRRCFEVLEGVIREHPALWLWGHKRWKTRPPDEQPRRDLYAAGGTATAPVP
jgi:KDO2-lipid IV(A) lauroyltransferase